MAMEHNYYTVQSTVCPYCGGQLDGATGVDDQTLKVKQGDCSCCITCGGVLEFDENLVPRVIRNQDWLTLPASVRSTLTKLSESIRLLKSTQEEH